MPSTEGHGTDRARVAKLAREVLRQSEERDAIAERIRSWDQERQRVTAALEAAYRDLQAAIGSSRAGTVGGPEPPVIRLLAQLDRGEAPDA